LSLIDRNDPICEIVAYKVIEIDKAGTHDPQEIANLAAKQFGHFVLGRLRSGPLAVFPIYVRNPTATSTNDGDCPQLPPSYFGCSVAKRTDPAPAWGYAASIAARPIGFSR
jgi:hypothetical protein